jgi:MFS transporter, AAHS family, 3-hydroxyphenylpropionic acid transporter
MTTAQSGVGASRAAAVVTLCFGIAALEGFDLQALGVAAPAMGPQLHLAKPLIGYAASATMAAMGVGAVVGGWLADRAGRRLVLFASLLIFAIATGLTAWAHDFTMLLAARVATGAGIGGAMPNLIAVAADPRRGVRRAAPVTILSAGLPAGAGACALLDRFTAAPLGWPVLFIVGCLAAIPIAPFVLLCVPRGAGRPEVAGPARNGLAQLFGEGRGSATTLLWVGICLTMVVLSTMTTWLPTLMIQKGLSRADASLVTFLFNVIGVASGLGLGLLIDRFGFVRPLIAAFVLMGAAALTMALATGFVPLALSAGLAGLACCSSQFGLYALFPRYYPLEDRSTGSGAGVAAGRVGSVLGPGLCGVLLGLGASPGLVVAVLIPAAVGGGVAVAALAAIRRRDEENAQVA